MHEYSLVQALLSQVAAQARTHGASAIHRVVVQIGELAGVDCDLFASAYTVFRERTACERAALAIRRVEARWICPACAMSIPRGEPLCCARCTAPARLVAGDEIVLERIEMEVP